MGNKCWSSREITELNKMWFDDSVSYEKIAKRLNRSVNAIIIKGQRLGLKARNRNSEYIPFYYFVKKLGLSLSYLTKLKKANFPIEERYVKTKKFKFVELEKFYKWIETGNNKHLVDFSRTQDGDFGALEPSWFEAKRQADKEYRKYKQTQWTEEEKAELKRLCLEYKYSYTQISKKLMRLETAIKRCFTTMPEFKARPLKKDNHTKWTAWEIKTVKDLYKKGFNSIVIRDYLFNKSQLAINALLERHNYFLNEGS